MNATTAIVPPRPRNASPAPEYVRVERPDLERLFHTIDDLYRCFDPARMSELIGAVHGLAAVVRSGLRPAIDADPPLSVYREPPDEPGPFEPDDEDAAWAAEHLTPIDPPADADVILAAVACTLDAARLPVTVRSNSVDFTTPNGVEWSLRLENMTLFYSHMEEQAREHDRETVTQA